MADVKGEMILIGCGGAGTSIVGNLSTHLKNLGDGFSDISTEYVDTSSANIKRFDVDEDNFFLIKSSNVGEEISGSGSIRAENATHIYEGAKDFVNLKDYNKNDLAKYYVIIASGSGGSGSMIAPNIASNLLEKDLNVLVIIVGDSSNKKSINNTLNTLASLNGVAIHRNKPLSIIYFDNAKNNGATLKDRLSNVDKLIFNHLTILSMFLSGDVTALDQKDMSVFFNIDLIADEVPAGLYALEYFKDKVELAKHHKLRVARTVTIEDVSPDLNLAPGVLPDHDKFGITHNENVINKLKDRFPIHYVSFANNFSTIEMDLRNLVEAAAIDSSNATVDRVSGTSKAKASKNGIVC